MSTNSEQITRLEAERDTARAEAKEAKEQLEHVTNLHELRGKALLMGSDEVKALRTEVERLTKERDEAQNTIDIWIMTDKRMMELNNSRAEVEILTRERDEWKEWNLVVANRSRVIDALRAEAARLTKEHQAAIDTGVYSNDAQLRTEVAQRRNAMADIVRELGHGCCGLSHDEIAPEVRKMMDELSALRATRDADHGAAIAAAAIKLGTQLYGACRGFHETESIRVAMRALVATITNSQLSAQGGGQTCNRDEESSSLPKSDPLAVAAPQSMHGFTVGDTVTHKNNYFTIGEVSGFTADLVRVEHDGGDGFLYWPDNLTVTNSQQKGGEEPCAPKNTSAPVTQPNPVNQTHVALSTEQQDGASSAAPTSDPEGAATPAEDAKRLADRIVKHVENGIVYEVGASHVSIVRDVFEKWIREAIEHHAIQQAAWHCETLAKLEAASPSPTVEKLAQEIDDLYEAPSRIRPLRRILAREFGASQSVAEAAKEIRKVFPMADQGRGYEALMTQSVESILSRFREHELRELREECERLRKDNAAMLAALSIVDAHYSECLNSEDEETVRAAMKPSNPA